MWKIWYIYYIGENVFTKISKPCLIYKSNGYALDDKMKYILKEVYFMVML